MTETVRVLLAEDSPTVRHYLKTLIEESPALSVVGEAHNGEEAVAMVARVRPDVVSMDINMPRLDGIAATRKIMQETPVPVVVVSSLLEREIELSLQALQAGALAVVSKPPERGHADFAERRQQLIQSLRAMAGVRVISRRPRRALGEQSVPMPENEYSRRFARPEVIVVGASTGGPSALHRLVQALPAHLSVPVVIVQHMPNEFIAGLARWLDGVTPLNVSVATSAQELSPGSIVVAPGTHHVTLARRGNALYTRFIAEPGDFRYQPSVDVLFESTAAVCGARAVGVILTGMGDDGARGLLAMRTAGALTLAQDETTSTVFGMPAAAIQCGAAMRVEPLTNLASEILKVI